MNKKFDLRIILLFLFILTSSLFILFVGPEWVQQRYSSIVTESRGGMGDAFGGTIGPIVAWIASVLTFAAFYVQYKANIQQNKAIKLQRFEDTFFRLLENYQRLVETTDLRKRNDSSTIVAVGRGCFKRIYLNFKNKVKNKHLREVSIEETLDTYHKIQDYYKSDLHHYYRFLYHILKFVKNYEMDESEKFKYTSILRASLSAYELILIFYNCLHEHGETHFKPLVVEYSMLKNLDFALLIDPSHKQMYHDLAFASSTDRRNFLTP
jgi:hypothetical protein